jgi:signal peptidase I
LLEANRLDNASELIVHDLSIRYKEQVIALDALDLSEVLSEPSLQLSGNITGRQPDGSKLVLEQTYKPGFKTKTHTFDIDPATRGRFRIDLKLHNGVNGLLIKAVDADGVVLGKKQFELQYKGAFREWNETIFIAFILAILIRGLVMQAFWIPTGSMEPTLFGEKRSIVTNQLERSGDRILVSRFAYLFDLTLDGRLPFGTKIWFKMPQRGDIVVFKYPDPDKDAPPKDYIKRVIGLPGDYIEIDRDGVLFVNKVPVYEPYIAEPPLSEFMGRTVPKDCLFVLGDNRNNSADSRYWGWMPLANLKGQAIFNYLPINRFGPIRSYEHNLTPKGATADATGQTWGYDE